MVVSLNEACDRAIIGLDSPQGRTSFPLLPCLIFDELFRKENLFAVTVKTDFRAVHYFAPGPRLSTFHSCFESEKLDYPHIWIPGHSGVECNEGTNDLTRRRATNHLPDPDLN